jgi:hypothetical protein
MFENERQQSLLATHIFGIRKARRRLCWLKGKCGLGASQAGVGASSHVSFGLVV